MLVFYAFILKSKRFVSGFLLIDSCALTHLAGGGGGGGWAGEEVGGEGWLVGKQTEAATSPQWLSVLAAGYAGLMAVLTAAKCRSMLALNGLW